MTTKFYKEWKLEISPEHGFGYVCIYRRKVNCEEKVMTCA